MPQNCMHCGRRQTHGWSFLEHLSIVISPKGDAIAMQPAEFRIARLMLLAGAEGISREASINAAFADVTEADWPDDMAQVARSYVSRVRAHLVRFGTVRSVRLVGFMFVPNDGPETFKAIGRNVRVPRVSGFTPHRRYVSRLKAVTTTNKDR